MIRIFVEQPDLREGLDCPLDEDAAHYLRQVMRRGVGEHVRLFNGQGGEFTARVTSLQRKSAHCRILRFHDVSREVERPIHIIQAASRNEKIEQVLQKGTELGASTFCICVSERSTLRLQGERLRKRLRRWRRILIEAAEQSGRTIVPDLRWEEQLPGATCDAAFYLHPQAIKGLGEYAGRLRASKDVELAIGPEGGWSSRECEILMDKGWAPLRFGARILRTETAAPALLAALQALWQAEPAFEPMHQGADT